MVAAACGALLALAAGAPAQEAALPASEAPPRDVATVTTDAAPVTEPVTTATAPAPPPPPAGAPAPPPQITPAPAPERLAAPAPERPAPALPRRTMRAGEPPSSPTEPAAPVTPGAPEDRCASADDGGACDGLMASGCTILGTDAADWLQGTDGDDVICGMGGDDRVEGRGGDDVLSGGDGDDALAGGEGDDCFVGGAGADTVTDGRESFESIEAEEPETGEAVSVDEHAACSGVKGVAQEAQGEAEAGSPQPAVAGPADAGAVFVAVTPGAAGSAGRFPVEVVGRATAEDGAVELTLFCDFGDESGELVVTDRRGRRLGAGPFRCESAVLDVEVELNRLGRRLLRRSGRLRALVQVTVGSARAEYPVRIRESDG